jgi:hypothetical protein
LNYFDILKSTFNQKKWSVQKYSGGITLGGWDGCRKSNPPTDCGLSKFTSYQELWSESAGHQAPPFSLVQLLLLECSTRLGMADNRIPDSSLSVSSSRTGHGKEKARYGCCTNENGGAWCPALNVDFKISK